MSQVPGQVRFSQETGFVVQLYCGHRPENKFVLIFHFP
jgi:hypothetical protein